MGDMPAGVARLKHPEDMGGDKGGDAALIARSRCAPECFALLFDRHGPAIHSYVARRLGQDAADDLTGEVFLIAFQRRHAYDTAYADARPWLYGIATNLAAAFQVLADVPGVRMKPGVRDPEGQTGTAVWQDSDIGYGLHYETTYNIIDPQTGKIIAGDTVAQTPVAGAAPGTVLFYSAFTSAYWTNRLPSHTP